MGLISKLTDFFYYSEQEEAAKVPSDWRKRRRWNKAPSYNTDEALLILAKATLNDALNIAEDAARYPEGSAIRRNAGEYIDVLMTMVHNTMDACERLIDTPLGDHAMLGTLTLIREQYQLAGEEICQVLVA